MTLGHCPRCHPHDICTCPYVSPEAELRAENERLREAAEDGVAALMSAGQLLKIINGATGADLRTNAAFYYGEAAALRAALTPKEATMRPTPKPGDNLIATQQNALATELAELCIKRRATLRESRNALIDAAGELEAMLDGEPAGRDHAVGGAVT